MLHHAYRSLSIIEAVEEFMLHLVPTINALKHKVCVPIKKHFLRGNKQIV